MTDRNTKDALRRHVADGHTCTETRGDCLDAAFAFVRAALSPSAGRDDREAYWKAMFESQERTIERLASAERDGLREADVRLLANVILGSTNHKPHREAADRILAALSEVEQ